MRVDRGAAEIVRRRGRIGMRTRGAGVMLALAVVCTGAVDVRLSAHRLDEYLQAARIDVEPARIGLDLDLTPGAAVSASVLADIDKDRDGQLSELEIRKYAGDVLRAIELTVDGHIVRPQLVAAATADVDLLRGGQGSIRVQSAVDVPPQMSGEHQIQLHNRHRPDVSVYLANALAPGDDRVAVTDQMRDADQSALTIRYVVREAPAAWAPWLFGVAAAALAGALRTIWMVQRIRQRRTPPAAPVDPAALLQPRA